MNRPLIRPRLLIVLSALFCLVFSGSAFAAQPAYPIDTLSTTGQVDWYTGTVNSLGVGTPPSKTISPNVTASPAAMQILTRFAAIEDAQRNLVKAIMNIPVNATNTLSSLPNPELSLEQATDIAKYFKVVDEKPLKDSTYQVVLQVSLTGKNGAATAIVNALKLAKPEDFPSSSALQPTTVAGTPDIPTGLIIELKDASLKRTFSPSIYDESGRLVYGAAYIAPDKAINKGLVQYTPEPEDIRVAEKVLSRVGLKPMTVRAVSLRDNDANIVISVADAEQILALQNISRFLDQCPVVIRQQQGRNSHLIVYQPKNHQNKR